VIAPTGPSIGRRVPYDRGMSVRKSCSVCGSEFEENVKFCPNDGTPLRATEPTRQTAPTDPLIGQVVADRYRIISMLGEGGMGRVYLAEHVRMARKCAVKMISPEMARTEAAVARFNREAANASQINHPNVVQVYDFGEGPNKTLYLAMEFVEGETMSALVRREGALTVRRAAMLTKQAADALSAAHHRGIVHRDLKPDNILVSLQYDGTECVKVVDFGIAKTVQHDGTDPGGQNLTTIGVAVGTPEYMSPEQLAGERLDTRSDLYSLGLVFFHLLTADLPHPRVTSRETLVARLTSPPRTLGEVKPSRSWPATLQTMLDWALATDPAKRYPTAHEFALDLGMLIAAEPIDKVEPRRTVPMQPEYARPSAPTVIQNGRAVPPREQP
jgi:eukaryotic-like serine/threonine-protein kinase